MCSGCGNTAPASVEVSPSAGVPDGDDASSEKGSRAQWTSIDGWEIKTSEEITQSEALKC